MEKPEVSNRDVGVSPDWLRDVGLFGGLDPKMLELLAEKLPLIHFESGEHVVEEGDAAQEMFVVLTGELEVVKQRNTGLDIRVAMFGPGDWFGEMSVLDVQPRSATVRALAPTQLLRISAGDVEQLLYRRDPKAYGLFIMNIARELSRRLRVADGILSQFMTSVSDYTKR